MAIARSEKFRWFIVFAVSGLSFGIGLIVLSSLFTVYELTLDETNGSLSTIVLALLALLGGFSTHAFLIGQQMGESSVAGKYMNDQLTGLFSRSGMVDQLAEFVEFEHNKTGREPFMIAIEFDSIKDINEVYGHDTGDVIIKVLADRLKRLVDELGPIGRINGAEFVVALSAASNERELKAAVDALIDALSQPIKVGAISMAVFGNAGVVKLNNAGMTLDVALRCATLARSAARDAGRGTWAIYHPEMSQVAAYRKWLESELASAIQRNELALNYQPQVNFATGRVEGYEALLRWTHHEKGTISPVEFISIAEECGLMRSIGSWVLRQACADAMQLDDSVIMSVNVSSVQLIEPDFIGILRDALKKSGLPPERLELEVTESVVITDYKTVRQRFQQIRRIGCPIAIDDFGTGYSNLTNLAELPFQKLKIDKSFVDEMLQKRNISSIVSAIVNMGHSLGARVIAEGVEYHEQATVLNAAGCSLMQGYLYSKPLRLADALDVGIIIKPEPRPMKQPDEDDNSKNGDPSCSAEGAPRRSVLLDDSEQDPILLPDQTEGQKIAV